MAKIATSTPSSVALSTNKLENIHNNCTNYTNNVDNTNDTTVLLNTFLIRKKQFRVFYNAGILMWERYQSKKGKVTVPIANVFGINPRSCENENADVANDEPTSQSPSTTSSATIDQKQFTIVYAKRSENSTNLNKWRYFSITLQCNDTQVIQLWIRTLQNAINEQTSRPKRLLLFVNPFGGKKRALQIYDYSVKPIFQLAGIDASVVISQRSNQVRDFIMTQSLEHFDGIVCIGGDGTFSEVFNGLIFRKISDLGINQADILDNIPKIEMPIGVIPAGSTDTVAYCLNGTTDIRTTVLNIVLGQIDGLDLSSVSNQNGIVKFYASVMSYGFLGDVAIESEKFRWMGPKRYDYSGFKKLLLNRAYEGEISMLLAPDDNAPTKGPACLENCQMCLSKKELQINAIKTNKSTVININSNENIGDSSGNDNKTNLKMMASELTNNNYNINNIEEMHTAKTVCGKFFMVNGANISCACLRSPNGFSKYCHLCDGYIDLILVRHTSFINNIKFLLAMSSQNCNISDLPHVEIYRTKQFSFRPNGLQSGASTYNIHSSRIPISNGNDNIQTSVWNCDGEVIHDSEVSIKSHRHLINVYRRGLYKPPIDDFDVRDGSSCCGLCV